MSICQEAAVQFCWDRHVDKALELSREREPAVTPAIAGPPVLLAIEGSRPDRAPKGSAHPSLRGGAS